MTTTDKSRADALTRLKLETQSVNYCIELSIEQFKKLEEIDFLEIVMPRMMKAGADDDIEYDGHFGPNVFFTAEEKDAEAVLGVVCDLLGVAASPVEQHEAAPAIQHQACSDERPCIACYTDSGSCQNPSLLRLVELADIQLGDGHIEHARETLHRAMDAADARDRSPIAHAPLEGTGNGVDEITTEHAFALYMLARTTDDSERWIAELRKSIDYATARAPRTEVAGAVPLGSVSVEALCARLDQFPTGSQIGITAMMKLIDSVAGMPPSADAAAAPADERTAFDTRACAESLNLMITEWVDSCLRMGVKWHGMTDVIEKRIARFTARAAASQPAAATVQAAGMFVKRSMFGPWIEVDKPEPGAVRLYTAPPAQVATRQGLADAPPYFWRRILDTLNQQGITWTDAGWVFTDDDRLYRFAVALLEGAKHE